MEAAEDQVGRALVVGDDELLHRVVDRRLDRRAEACAHVDTIGTERERGGEATAIAETAARQHRHAHLVGGGGDQDEAGNVVLTGMAGAFETVDRNGIDAHPLGGQRMADGGAFVDDGDAVRLEMLDMLLRAMAGGFDDGDTHVDDRPAIVGIGRRRYRGQDGEVHPERLVGHRPAAFDLAAQIVGRRLGEGGEDAEAAGVGHRRGQFGAADPHHAALHDRMFDTEQVGDACAQRHQSASTMVTLAMPPPSHMVWRP